MNRLTSTLIGGAIAVGSWYFTGWEYHEEGDYYVDSETDAYVDEVYLQDPAVELIPLGAWIERSEKNKVDYLDRSDALFLARRVESQFGLELVAAVDAEYYGPHETGTLLARSAGFTDYENMARLVRNTIPKDSSIEFGDSWVMIDIYSDWDGEEE